MVGVALLGLAPVGVSLEVDGAGEVRVGVRRLPQTLDPATAAGGPELMVFRLLFEGLVEFGEDGDLQAALATRWTVSRDGLTWTFDLRPDVRFQDGTRLTPEIVAVSLARHLTPGEPPEDAAPATGLPRARARVFPGTTGLVTAVRPRGARRVEIHLQQRFSPLLALLAHPALAIVLTQTGAEVPFLGTGPYRVASHAAGRLVLQAAAPPAGESEAPRLVFSEVPDDAAGIAELRPGGLLDVYFPQSPPAWAGLGLRVLAAPTWQTGLLALRTGGGLLASQAARWAVALALDPELVEAALGRWATRYTPYLPPNAWAAFPTPRPAPNPGEARRLLGETGVLASVLTLLAPRGGDTGPDRLAVAEAIRHSLAVAGVQVNVRVAPGERYAEILQRGEAHLALIERASEVNDPHFLLSPLVASAAAARGRPTNVAFYANALADNLLLRASQVTFRPERQRLYHRLQTLLAEELPYIPLYVRRQWAVARPTVEGLHLDVAGRHRLDHVRIRRPVTPSASFPPGPPPAWPNPPESPGVAPPDGSSL
jgi:ABC-type transport system substrate-binding protein